MPIAIRDVDPEIQAAAIIAAAHLTAGQAASKPDGGPAVTPLVSLPTQTVNMAVQIINEYVNQSEKRISFVPPPISS
jgi:uncharacterized protein (UPF0333 family)